jgi:hypothetical protein
MDAVAPFAALGEAARVLVHNDDLAVLHHVLPVEQEVAFDLDRPLDVLIQVDQADRGEQIGLGQRADELAAGRGQLDLLVVVLVFVVFVLGESRHHLGGPAIRGNDLLDRLVAQRADDQRRAGLVDQDAVGLIDQSEVGAPLHGLLAGGVELRDLAENARLGHAHAPQEQPISHEVEAEFLSRAVSNVAGVSLATVFAGVLGQDGADRQAKHLVDRPHVVGVALGQVIVDRGQVGALARQGVNIEGQRGRERLAFARFHLGDAAVKQGDAADHLHVVMPLADGPNRRRADEGIGLGQELHQRFARFGPVLQRKAPLLQIAVRFLFQLRLKGGDLGQRLAPLGQAALDRPADDRQHAGRPAGGNAVNRLQNAHIT